MSISKLKTKAGVFLFILSFFSLFTACGIYSFSGASIPAGAKTISIAFFPNKAPLVVPSLSQQFTESLQDIFSSQTQLILVERNGDLQISGEITDYSILPQAISGAGAGGQQTGQLNRITITVNVRFVNKLEPDKDFETTFSDYTDESSDVNLDNPTSQIDIINDKLVENIFNKAVVNW
ncbi:MAG: LptE family protein [Bacteroidales bacterium]